MRIHYNKIHEHPYSLWQWVLCVSMYTTRNRTIDWRSGVHNDTIWALICASVNMWTHLLYGICTALLFSIWMHPHDLRMRNDIVGSFFGIAGSWKWMAMNGYVLFHNSGVGWSWYVYFFIVDCMVCIGFWSSSILPIKVQKKSRFTIWSMWILHDVVFIPLHFYLSWFINTPSIQKDNSMKYAKITERIGKRIQTQNIG